MYQQIKTLYLLLTKSQRKKLVRLQAMVIIMAFAEVGGVFAIGPFMALVADTSALAREGWIGDLYGRFSLNEASFMIWLGAGALIALFVAACVSIYTTWRLASYSFQLGAELGVRLYRHYMGQSWLFHANGNSASLINKISVESSRLTSQIINPLLQMVARVVLIVVMAAAILIYDPLVAVFGIAIFATGYFILYRTARRKLVSNGQVITASSRERMRLMQEGFGGIKDTLLLGRQKDFNDRFEKQSEAFGKAQGNNAVLGQVPRYAMELLAYGSVILLVLYLLSSYQGDLTRVLPTLAVYSLAGFKLLPAFQQVYSGFASIRGNLAAYENLLNDFAESTEERQTLHEDVGRLSVTREIVMDSVEFSYPSKESPALQSLSLRIPVQTTIGIVGASGSGKSTAIDILLGLIEPQKGQVIADDQPITTDNRRAWQNCLGYVPQAIFLADSTIRENIAFGVPAHRINDERVINAVKLAHLEELIDSLPEGLNTRVGERGVQLSGGQRQRIGIARALYEEADVLVFDEATSALDGITEKLVMDAIHDFSGKKTIVIIAHRLATVKACDRIYLMSHGRVVDSGSYEDLIARNKTFKKMAAQA